ncbi:hypothetical protein AVEN_224738-1 [Araneus ventricosus]|uniref:Uncharacterized protein n=1 Tax=Araneus ventricosus TaxID=182803 RepID=A0A4Y2HWC3_ARAVE|nr:hypothetical protein AVEN_224738-1 [Araneus ventricosus]
MNISVPGIMLRSTRHRNCNLIIRKKYFLMKMKFSLSTSRSEATRRLFCDGFRHFESQSDGEGARSGIPSPSFRTILAGRRLEAGYDLACSGSHSRVDLHRGIEFRTWNLLSLRPRPYH